jgi:hypothetical protein
MIRWLEVGRLPTTALKLHGQKVGNMDSCRFYVQVDWICKHMPTFLGTNRGSLSALAIFRSLMSARDCRTALAPLAKSQTGFTPII